MQPREDRLQSRQSAFLSSISASWQLPSPQAKPVIPLALSLEGTEAARLPWASKGRFFFRARS